MAHLISIVVESPVEAQMGIGILHDKRFLSLKLNDGDLTLILPGNDAEAVASAREIAAVLTDAADTLQDTLLRICNYNTRSEAALQDEADSRD